MKISVLLFIAGVFSSLSFSQETDSVPMPERVKLTTTGGLVAYYFWEEDSTGAILKNDISKPFIQNFYILKQQKHAQHLKSAARTIPPAWQIQKAINYFAHDTGSDAEKSLYAIRDSARHIERLRFPLIKTAAENYGSVVFYNKAGRWESMKRQTVLYFTIDSAGIMRYTHANDSILLMALHVKQPANNHYVVYSYLKANGRIDFQRVVNYENVDVTLQFTENTKAAPIRMLVFANGYRGPKRDHEPTDGLVTQKDRYGYWYKLDNQFIKQLEPVVTYYIDGSLPLATSNHRTKFGFVMSYLRARLSFRKKKSKRIFTALNTESNETGFNERKEKGNIAGLAFLYARCNSPECENVKDTIDIVCHSMGYAYSLGFIETIKTKVVLGNIYIIAPENACMAGSDWSLFRQVWQYGTNLDQENPSPLRRQDGIAPQCAVKGLDQLSGTVGGRAFFPEDWPNMNFIDSHMVYSYDWIFRIKEGEPGFVTK